MTIRVHSGVPGTGKSLTVVDTIENDKSFSARPVFAHAVEGWDRAEPIRCENVGCRVCRLLPQETAVKMKTVETWQEWAPPTAVLVIDEAHYPFPSRRESAPPLHIVRLTEHRHDGIDFWLCTPNVNLLDINVRRLVEQHIHFQKGRLGRYTYTHTEVMANDEALKFGDKRRFTLPKRSFSSYKSADAHVTLKAKMPKVVYVLGSLVAVMLIAGFFTYKQAGEMQRPDFIEAQQQAALRAQPEPVVVRESVPITRTEPVPVKDELTRAAFWADRNSLNFNPRLAQWPESAPAFDSSPVPVFPPPTFSGCIATAVRCSCYSDQIIVLPIPEATCLAMVFDPVLHPRPRGAPALSSAGALGGSQ